MKVRFFWIVLVVLLVLVVGVWICIFRSWFGVIRFVVFMILSLVIG